MAGNGGIIGPPNTVSNGCAACGTAPGVWQMNTVYSYVKNSDWVYNFAAVDYLVVAGGGGGGTVRGGGGGAGGYQASGYGPSPLRGSTLTVRQGTFPVVVGAGGAGMIWNPATAGVKGSNSSFSTITSTGGGFGAGRQHSASYIAAGPGGSGGGGGVCSPICGAAGTPGQGSAGGNAASGQDGGGGGGVLAVGGNAKGRGGGDGGAGAPNAISGNATFYGGGGGGGDQNTPNQGAGGAGGGGAGGVSPGQAGTPGTANTGGGGGGGSDDCSPTSAGNGGTGGPGVVVLRSSTSFTTDSACAPVNFNGTDYIGTFKASTNINLGTANPFTAFDYLVVGGGGAGGYKKGGGGGAGGFRTSFPGGTKLYLGPGPNTIQVGAGGTTSCSTPAENASGEPSVVGLITAAGGGGGGTGPGPLSPPVGAGAGHPGGSGGGVSDQRTNPGHRGVGNEPPVSPPQGNPGGNGMDFPPSSGGGGGGGASPGCGGGGGAGGSRIVILRIATACAPGCLAAAPGTNTIATDGSDKVITFTVDGTLTV